MSKYIIVNESDWDDGGIRGIVEDFINNNPSSPFPMVAMMVALEISVGLLSRFNRID